MDKIIRIVFGGMIFPRGMFDMGPGERRFKPSNYIYPKTEDAWRSDWNNIGGDFRRSASRLELEFS